MSRLVKVAAGQLGPSGNTKEENVERMKGLIDRAAQQGASIISFPELSLTPYFPIKNARGYEDYFEPVESPHLAAVIAYAAKQNMAAVIPFGERDGIQLFNGSVISDVRGKIVGRYR